MPLVFPEIRKTVKSTAYLRVLCRRLTQPTRWFWSLALWNLFYKNKFMFIIYLLSAINFFCENTTEKIFDCSTLVYPHMTLLWYRFPNDIFNVKRPELSKKVRPITPGSDPGEWSRMNFKYEKIFLAFQDDFFIHIDILEDKQNFIAWNDLKNIQIFLAEKSSFLEPRVQFFDHYRICPVSFTYDQKMEKNIKTEKWLGIILVFSLFRVLGILVKFSSTT